MLRYAFTGDISKIEKYYFDVVIVGSGIAGLYTAINLDKRLSCVILSKSGMESGSSWLAQGGIAAVTNNNDSTELHYRDTLNAGAGLCDKNAVKVLVEEGPRDINNLLSLNVPFDVTASGQLQITKEGGHSRKRILHSGGDATGKGVTERLTQIAVSRDNVTMIENISLIDILTSEKQATGVLMYDGEYKVFFASSVVICTGGIGQIYKYSTNPSCSMGDGIAAAIRAGANVKDMEFVQFHPTAFYDDKQQGQAFLISEAVRGEGAVLFNHSDERFMTNVHPMAELAARDIVARAISNEMIKHSTSHVFLDITSHSKEYLETRFPTIYNHCMKHGFDLSNHRIPVCPVQHYFMGGIKTDLHGATNILGLYSCGESACTGVHGANRLASNSLLECLVFGRRCAQHINNSYRPLSIFQFDLNHKNHYAKSCINEIRHSIKNIMMNKAGIIRNERGLLGAQSELKSFQSQLEEANLSELYNVETYNMNIIALQIVESALLRKESIGAHFREDILINGGIKVC